MSLRSGPAAYTCMTVTLNPQTLQRLDAWMPIEDVAWTWAQHNATTHAATPKREPTITLGILEDPTQPPGRALTAGSFREHPQTDDRAWALARCPLTGQPHFLEPEAFERLIDQVELVDLAGETRGFRAGKAERVGVVGQITLRVRRIVPRAGTALAAVSRLAEYRGVGAQTTYGAGSVRILRHRAQRST